MKTNRTKQSAATVGLVLALIFGLPSGGLFAADSAQAATEIALDQLNGDGRILSVSESGDVFKVKVLVEGKVRVLKIPKDSDSGDSSSN